MTMISYAQNCEDVRLNRVFPDQSEGFYIDVGACLPIGHSVTKYFYERGWRGINIEPLPAMHVLIEADRPRDINLNCGISNHVGTLTLYEAVGNLGRSTFELEACESWKLYDGCEFTARPIPVLTLTQVCEQHVTGPIDFLKIDVEGHELAVMQGFDIKRWQPRVVVLEGRPDAWEHLLLDADYCFAAEDGLNRYYVRVDQQAMIPLLAAPLSILDDYVLHEHLVAVHELKFEIAQLHSRLQHSQTELAETHSQLAAAHAQINDLRTTNSQNLPVNPARADELGPTATAVAIKVRGVFRHVPGASRLIRKMINSR